ncbi:uncharacterized protein LOC143621020 [Bidens hawaiensis]|uniref:uncharacterized protein LOC143621020 n=1 Tax=Bidens hawaiensis TaxID=980011 RepID=UPI00404AE08C
MKFLDSLENCTKLETLDLSYCNFQGELPRSLGNLSNNLCELYLYENQLHGNLPTSIGNLVGLNRLRLDGNYFTGNIPSTIGNLKRLQAIDLCQNQLAGQIPDSIGNLSSMITISLFSNKLEGIIPSSLGKCHSMLELYLNDNKLNGKIPTKLFQLSSLSIKLNLSQNNLIGSIPTEVENLKMMDVLDLSENNLSGKVPSSLSGCASLSSLLLANNLLQGMIPPSLFILKGLVELDVSHNNLSGQIPKFLERLKYLNMSYNDFEGEVPTSGVFANATTFSVLGNSRLCGGFIELDLPKSYAWCRKKSKNQLSQPSTRKRLLQVSYNQLLKATNGFSEANLIGNGGSSFVYKGILDEDINRFVAVKVIHLQNIRAQRSFMRECETWRKIRHRNLLKIITSCSSVDFQGNDFKALVYEFMPNRCSMCT